MSIFSNYSWRIKRIWTSKSQGSTGKSTKELHPSEYIEVNFADAMTKWENLKNV